MTFALQHQPMPPTRPTGRASDAADPGTVRPGRTRRPVAVAGLLRGATDPAPVTVRRLLSDADVQTLRPRCIALDNRIRAAAAQTPDPFGGPLIQPLLDPVAEVSDHLKHPANYDLAGETQRLDSAEEHIAQVEAFVQDNAHMFAALRAIYLAEPGATRPALFADVLPTMRKLGEQLIDGSLRDTDLARLKSDLEKALIPQDNKTLQSMSKGDAVGVVQKMIKAGMVTVGKWTSAYASEYDAPQDNFGGAWKLEATASAGKFQWVRTWEFHVHARVVRAGGPGTAVTGFTIHRAHIKPSANKMQTGASIVVSDQAVLNAIENNPDTIRRLANWAETTAGVAALKKIT